MNTVYKPHSVGMSTFIDTQYEYFMASVMANGKRKDDRTGTGTYVNGILNTNQIIPRGQNESQLPPHP